MAGIHSTAITERSARPANGRSLGYAAALVLLGVAFLLGLVAATRPRLAEAAGIADGLLVALSVALLLSLDRQRLRLVVEQALAEERMARLSAAADLVAEQMTHVRHEYANGAARMAIHAQRLRELMDERPSGASPDRRERDVQAALDGLEREREALRSSTDAILRYFRARIDQLGETRSSRSMRDDDLAIFVGEAVDMLEDHAAAKDIEISLRSAPSRMNGDAELLAVVARNLIDNAIKYTLSGGRIAIACYPQGHEIVLRVQDSGPGIPCDMRERIFEGGFRLPGSESERGSGYGLANAREYVRLHGGAIAVENGPLGGAAFEVRFPAIPDGERAS